MYSNSLAIVHVHCNLQSVVKCLCLLAVESLEISLLLAMWLITTTAL